MRGWVVLGVLVAWAQVAEAQPRYRVAAEIRYPNPDGDPDEYVVHGVALDNQNRVLGHAEWPQSVNRAFIWNAGTIVRTLPNLEVGSEPRAMNDKGVVVGVSRDRFD